MDDQDSKSIPLDLKALRELVNNHIIALDNACSDEDMPQKIVRPASSGEEVERIYVMAPLMASGESPGEREDRKSVMLGQSMVEYILKFNPRSRYINMRITEDGLVVSGPPWTNISAIERALQAKADWILTHLEKARLRALEGPQKIVWSPGVKIQYLGEEIVIIAEQERHRGRAIIALEPAGACSEHPTLKCLALPLTETASPFDWREFTLEWLKFQARRFFTQRLDHYSEILAVRWQRLYLSSAKTSWGHASSSGNIRLNWRLIQLDKALIDYVVVHELAHLRHMNHSKRFWDQVRAILPDYEKSNEALRHMVLPPF